MNLLYLYSVVKANITDLFRDFAPGMGRGVDILTNYPGNPDPVDQTDVETYHDLSLTPYIYAGLRHRSISRLWTSASGIGSQNSGEAFSPPQIVYPPYTGIDGNDDIGKTVGQLDRTF